MKQLNNFVWAGKHSIAFCGFPIVLTPRQQEVLLLLCEGLPNKWISRRLGVSDATVKTHVASVLRSLNASTRLEAVILAFRLGLVQAVPTASASHPQDERGYFPASTTARDALAPMAACT